MYESDHYDTLEGGKEEELDQTNGFIAKVYSILTAQLAVTVAMTALAMAVPAVREFQQEATWLLVLAVVGAVGVQVTLMCCRDVARKVPTNYLLLLAFTVCEGYLVSAICSAVAQSREDGGQIVLLAASMTLALVAGLTFLATFLRLTGRQFQRLYYILLVVAIALLCLGVANFFVRNQFLNTLYCSLGVLLFGLYLVVDTALILQVGKWGITIDDYILASLVLYIDIVSMFLYILRLLARR